MISGTTDKLKFKILQRHMGLLRWEACGLLQSLWNLTAEATPDGGVGRFTNEEIAIGIEWNKDADKLIDDLIATKWLDEIPEDYGRLYIHDWHEHCENTVHRKLARVHSFFANGKQPNLARLESKYKDEAEEFYTENTDKDGFRLGQSALVGAESALICAESAPLPYLTVTNTDTDTVDEAVAPSGADAPFPGEVVLGLREEFHRGREAHLAKVGSTLKHKRGNSGAECKAVLKILKWLPEFIQGDPIDNFHGLLEFMDVTVWSDGGSWWDVKRSLSGLVKAKGDVTGGFTRLVSAYGKSEQHVAPQPDRVVDGVIQSSDRAIDGMRVPTPEQLCAADGIPPTEENLKKVME